MNNAGYDWERFWIHFVFGAVLGAVAGGGVWLQSGWYGLPAWLCLSGFSLVLAVLAGIYGDRFWEWFMKNLRWW